MGPNEIATEITKAWLSQLKDVRAGFAAAELKQVYLAAIEAYLESIQKIKAVR